MLNTLPLTYTLYTPREPLSEFCFTVSTTTEEHFDIAYSCPRSMPQRVYRVAVPNPRNEGGDYFFNFFTNGYPVSCVPIALARRIWIQLVKEGWIHK